MPRPQPKKKTNWAGCVCGTSLIAFVVAAVAIILGAVAIGEAGNLSSQRVYETSIDIQPTPYQIGLGSDSGGALLMTLPNDMYNFVGRRYTINSLNAQMHTVTIDSGTLATTWDGVNKIATFGGAKGDGFTFVVLEKDLIRIESVTNVVFSV